MCNNKVAPPSAERNKRRRFRYLRRSRAIPDAQIELPNESALFPPPIQSKDDRLTPNTREDINSCVVIAI